jgi:hypothetical protein
MDTLETETRWNTQGFRFITSVEIEYRINRKFSGTISHLRSDFTGAYKGQKIDFIYDQFPIEVKSVNPLFCLDKKLSDVKECECKKSIDDPDDYLYKICEYVKKGDKYKEYASQLKLQKISVVKKTIRYEDY